MRRGIGIGQDPTTQDERESAVPVLRFQDRVYRQNDHTWSLRFCAMKRRQSIEDVVAVEL